MKKYLIFLLNLALFNSLLSQTINENKQSINNNKVSRFSKSERKILENEFQQFLNCKCLESFIDIKFSSDSITNKNFLSFDFLYFSSNLSRIGFKELDSLANLFILKEVKPKLFDIQKSEYGLASISGYKFYMNSVKSKKVLYLKFLWAIAKKRKRFSAHV